MRRVFEMLVALAVWVSVLALGAALASGALAATSPAVVTGNASHLGQSSAVLNGTVNPNGSSTTYFFQWGLTNAYGVNGKPHSAGSGTKAVAVHTTAGNLKRPRLTGPLTRKRLVIPTLVTAAGIERMAQNGHGEFPPRTLQCGLQPLPLFGL